MPKTEEKLSFLPKRECSTSTTTILDLNDDILRETFTHLGTFQLGAIADVCSTFKRIAQAEISSRQKTTLLQFYISVDDEQDELGAEQTPLRQLPSLLRNFGPLLTDIEINLVSMVVCYSQQIMELIVRYCGGTLNVLILKKMKIDEELLLTFQPLLRRLQTLHLVHCFFKTESIITEMCSCCPELRTLLFLGVRDLYG